MLFAALWIVLGLYLSYLGFEVLFLKNTKKLPGLKQKHNPAGYALRFGLIQFIGGILVIAGGICNLVFENATLFTINIGSNAIYFQIHQLNICICLLIVIALVLNEVLSKKDE